MVMNPVRQRIFQYFLLHEAGTVKELKRALPECSERKSVPPYQNPCGAFYPHSRGREPDPRHGRKRVPAEQGGFGDGG